LNSILKYILPILLVVGIIEGCKKLPHYSDVPQIEFSGFEIYRNHYNVLSLSYEDSVIIKLKFKDGDGDLGLDEEDKKTDTLPNFVMQSYVKVNSVFVDSVKYTGQFQPLTLSAKQIKGPIEGELRYVQRFSYADFNTNDTLKFDIHIKDRAGNISNIVTTDILVVNSN